MHVRVTPSSNIAIPVADKEIKQVMSLNLFDRAESYKYFSCNERNGEGAANLVSNALFGKYKARVLGVEAKYEAKGQVFCQDPNKALYFCMIPREYTSTYVDYSPYRCRFNLINPFVTPY